jgi:hypothetical protein
LKPFISALKKDQTVWALVEEVLSVEEIIANFSGDLIRVVNHSGKNLKVGQRIQLHVDDVSPLRLSLVHFNRASTERTNSGGIDFSI